MSSFIIPPNPAKAAQEPLHELDRLRDAQVSVKTKTESLQATLDTEVRLKTEAEASAKEAFEDLDAAFQLAEQSEQQLAAEREQFQQRLAELQTSSAAAPVEQRKATIAASQQQESEVDLDEEATRHIIDAQLRGMGWEPAAAIPHQCCCSQSRTMHCEVSSL